MGLGGLGCTQQGSIPFDLIPFDFIVCVDVLLLEERKGRMTDQSEEKDLIESLKKELARDILGLPESIA